jgi:two-component system, LytTR family, response regulator
MNPLRVVIADDEPVARQRLRRLLGEREDCHLLEEFEDGIALAAGIGHLAADVVLLDIDMPGRDGFASLGTLPEPRPIVVFVTAFAEHASRAFDIDAVDYLLKPVSGARLGEALARVSRRLAGNAAGRRAVARFVVQGRSYLFDPTRIATIQAFGNYVEISTDTQKVQLRLTLTDALARLDPGAFIRVHRSWVVARAAINEVTSLPGARHDIRLKDGRHIPGGRAFSHAIIAEARARWPIKRIS